MKKIIIILLIILTAFFFANCSNNSAESHNDNNAVGDESTNKDNLTSDDIMGICSDCHKFEKVYDKARDITGWETVVNSMITKGAKLEKSDIPVVAEFVYKHTGEKLVEERCTSCHDMSKIESVSHDKEGWQKVVDKMIDLGAKLNDKEAEVVVDYLVATYPAE